MVSDITNNTELLFRTWKEILPQKFIEEFENRRQVYPNNSQRLDHPIRFINLINSISWGPQPEDATFWSKLAKFKFENYTELYEHLCSINLQSTNFKKIELKW